MLIRGIHPERMLQNKPEDSMGLVTLAGALIGGNEVRLTLWCTCRGIAESSQ